MSTVMERRSSIVEFPSSLVDTPRESEPTTFDRTSFTYGANRSLPPTHAKSRDFATYKLTERLHMYRGLDEGWDGYNGAPATFGSFTNTIEFVKKLPIRFTLPVSMLAGDGEISLFWKCDGHYLEASFPGDNTYHFIYKSGDSKYASPDLMLDSPQLDAKFIEILGRI